MSSSITDRVNAMLSKLNGIVARTKQKNRHMRSTHCCFLRQALVVKKIPEELKGPLNDCVKSFHFIV